MRTKGFYSIWAAESDGKRGLGAWFWLLVIVGLELLLIRWINQMQREAARRARLVDQARRAEISTGEAQGPTEETAIRKAAKPLPEPEEEPAPIQKAREKLPEPGTGEDNFRNIEGIGPKVNTLLHEAGIRTYQNLAEKSEQDLRDLLREAKLFMINPSDWPEQAKLAAKGDWEGLEALQERLRG
jgi:predicted flap endonuclease-1-like 5' DNA nuclease